MFRFTGKPSSGSYSQYLAKNYTLGLELLKHFKISKTTTTCFSLQGNHHQGATVST